MGNFKSAIILAISVFMTIVLVGCGNNEPDEYPQGGRWTARDMFVNEWFGIQFQLPAGWDAPTGRELEELLGVGATLMYHSDHVELSEEMIEAMEEGQVHDMYAINFATGSTAQMIFERIPRALRSIEVESVLEQFLHHMDDMGLESGAIREETALIGDMEFHVIDAVMNVFGVELHMSTFINLEGRNIRSISIGSQDQSELEVILGYFNVVGAERIESVAPVFEMPEADEDLSEADFVGMWDWNIGDYTYDFREDGTGVRGFPGMDEEFTWELVNGELQIRVDMIIELWRPIIDGDVLTITSLQVEGVSYSYIRR